MKVDINCEGAPPDLVWPLKHENTLDGKAQVATKRNRDSRL
jgi:hypothetical protein